VSTATQTLRSARPRVQLTTSQRYELDLLALGDAARLAKVWEHALAASFRLGAHAGYRSGWLAGRDEEAIAWQSIVTGYSTVMSQPNREELARLRRPSNDPCTAACGWCSQCIRAQSVLSNLARYGSPNCPGTGFPGTGHLNSRHAGSAGAAS